jgi:hypothetical protein
MGMTGAELLVAAWRLLDESEQERAYNDISRLCVLRQASDESITGRLIRSLLRVAEHVGHEPSVGDYNSTQRDLRGLGEDIAPFHEQVTHFGTWREAKEALGFAETSTARQIEERFRQRRLGKIWRYSEATLEQTLRAAADHYQRAPTVAEFEWWRLRELEKAIARGEDTLHLPSVSPYRKRWRTWEGALLHFGYTLEEATERFEQR